MYANVDAPQESQLLPHNLVITLGSSTVECFMKFLYLVEISFLIIVTVPISNVFLSNSAKVKVCTPYTPG